MSYNAINLNYELDNEQLNENISLYNRADINKIEIRSGERLNNFISKAILSYILNELNHDIICDFHIIGVGNVDLHDISARTAYIFDASQLTDYQQLITELYLDSAVDIIAINLEELPDDIFQRYMKLKEYVFSD